MVTFRMHLNDASYSGSVSLCNNEPTRRARVQHLNTLCRVQYLDALYQNPPPEHAYPIELLDASATAEQLRVVRTMRLLNVHTFTLNDPNEHDFSDAPPAYAILSHRWRRGTELTFEDVEQKTNQESLGYKKVQGLCTFVRKHLPEVHWIWSDSCCIDRKSSSILSESINSMFRYYQNSRVCITYMDDVGTAEDHAAFVASTWFTRGWTLQELIAPPLVVFTSKDWQVIGHRSGDVQDLPFDIGVSLDDTISAVTTVPSNALHDFQPRKFTVDEKFRWLRGRETTRGEDMSYCLLGLMDVSMPAIYGEGGEAAKRRLLATLHIDKVMQDNVPMTLKQQISVAQSTVSNYVERPALSARLEHLMAEDLGGSRCQHAVVVNGIGGSGKTQLVLRYIAVHEAKYSLVMWIDCRSSEAAQASYASYSAALQLPIKSDETTNETAKAVLRWLQSCQQKWLVVLDNLDDLEWDVDAIIPKGTLGSIIVTSQDTLVRRFFGRNAPQIKVDSMENDEASSLLLAPVNDPSEMLLEDAKQIASLLDRHALALDLAVARITFDIEDGQESERAFKQYLEDLNAHRDEMLRHDEYSGSARYSKSLWSVWTSTFTAIKAADTKHNANAIDLLFLLTQLDRANIQEELFRLAADGLTEAVQELRMDVPLWLQTLLKRKADGSWDDYHYRNSSKLLLRFGVVNRSLGEWKGLSMHSLVQWRAQQDLDIAECERWAIVVLAAAATHMKTSIGFRRHFIRHVQDIEPSRYNIPNRQRAWLCLVLGETFDLAGMSSKASELLEKAMTVFEVASMHTTHALGCLASIRRHQGRFVEAEEYSQRVLALRHEHLGDEHALTIAAMQDLSMSYMELGDWRKAEPLIVAVVAHRTASLGADHPDTLSALYDLADVYEIQGQFLKSKQITEQVLDVRRRLLGPEHADTVNTFHALGVLLYYLGHTHDSEKLLETVLELRCKVLGPLHPTTLDTKLDLMWICTNLHRWQKAMDYYTSANEDLSAVLGEEHPSVLNARHALATLLVDQSKYLEAITVLKQILEISMRVLGATHPKTLWTMATLAGAYRAQGKYQEAKNIQEEVAKMSRAYGQQFLVHQLLSLANIEELGDNWSAAESLRLEALSLALQIENTDYADTTIITYVTGGPQTLRSIKRRGSYRPLSLEAMRDLCGTYVHLDRFRDAEDLAEQIIDFFREDYGEHNAYTLEATETLGVIYYEQGRFDIAEELLTRVHRDMVQHLGAAHVFACDLLLSLAELYTRQERYDDLEKTLSEVRKARETCCGPQHYNTLSVASRLACVYSSTDRFEEAEQLHSEILTIITKDHGPQHVWTVEMQENYASSLEDKEDWAAAAQLRQTIMETRLMIHGDNHLCTLTARRQLFDDYVRLMKWEQMIEVGVEVVRLATDIHGLDHDDTLFYMGHLGRAYSKLKRHADAIHIHEQAMARWLSRCGNDHDDSMLAKISLAVSYRAAERLEEAIKLYEDVLTTRRRLYGDSVEVTIKAMSNLAITYRHGKQYEKSSALMEEVLTKRIEAHGQPHPTVCVALQELSLLRRDQRMWVEAAELQHAALNDYIKIHHEEHTKTCLAVKILRQTYLEFGRAKTQDLNLEEDLLSRLQAKMLSTEAQLSALQDLERNYALIKMSRRLLPIKIALAALLVQLHGEEHDASLEALENVAVLYDDASQWQAAEQTHRDCLSIRIKMYSEEHPKVMETMFQLGYVLDQQDRYDEALTYFQIVEQRWEETLGLQHPDTLRALNSIGNLNISLGQFDDAIAAFMKAWPVLSDVYGPTSELTLRVMLPFAKFLICVKQSELATEILACLLPACEESLGPQHLRVLDISAYLVMGNWNLGRVHESKEHFKRLSDVVLADQGSGYETALASPLALDAMARYVMDAGFSPIARRLGEQAMAIATEAVEAKSISEVEYIVFVGLVHRSQERWSEAEEVYRRFLGRESNDKDIELITVRLEVELESLGQEMSMLDVD